MGRFDAPDDAEVDIEKFLAFLRMGRFDDGSPITTMLGAPETGEEEHRFRFPWIPFSENDLPKTYLYKNSGGELKAYETDWKRAWHGTKVEALYSIMCEKEVNPSEDEKLGHRFSPRAWSILLRRRVAE